MSLTDKVKQLFKIREGHTPKVLLYGGTTKEVFAPFMAAKNGLEEEFNSMDENASRAGFEDSPVFFLIQEGSGHSDVIASVPLQNWSSAMIVEDSVWNSCDLRRITDWTAGFMDSFCARGTVHAIDLTTGGLAFGTDHQLVEDMLNAVLPKRDIKELIEHDIGSVDDVLSGQLSNDEIAKMVGKEEEITPEELLMKMNRLAAEVIRLRNLEKIEAPVEDKAKKEQEEIVKKYGWNALEELLAKTGQPLLIKKRKKA